MSFRKITIVVFAVLVISITWLRSPPLVRDTSQVLTIEPLDIAPRIGGDAQFERAWHLKSKNSDFGGYSALIIDGNGRMFAGSDRGQILLFDAPNAAEDRPFRAGLGRFTARRSDRKALSDLESLTRDPATGRIWAAFEGINTIERVDEDLSSGVQVKPELMRDWSTNSGPEAMVRLKDGRFVVLSEGRSSWSGNRLPALLFAGDPIENDEVAQFHFVSPGKYRPVDAAQIPDGRVLILLRDWSVGFPMKFVNRIVVADPADIAPGEGWAGTHVARIGDPSVADNYEGITVEQNDDETLTLWLISDDNRATYQRTLLLKLRWDPRPSLAS